MSWDNCGTDSKGREIGYCIDAICDHPDCNKEINRGVAYACRGMHGESEFDCEKYFCDEHLYFPDSFTETEDKDEGVLLEKYIDGLDYINSLCENCCRRFATWWKEEGKEDYVKNYN